MSPTTRIILGSLSVPMLGFGYFSLRSLPPYIPDRAMMGAVLSAETPEVARNRMFALLKTCIPHGDFKPDDLQTKMSMIRSFENDAGILGVTRILCTRTRCVVSASALIPHVARPDICGGPRSRRGGYSGRRNGWNDWFVG